MPPPVAAPVQGHIELVPSGWSQTASPARVGPLGHWVPPTAVTLGIDAGHDTSASPPLLLVQPTGGVLWAPNDPQSPAATKMLVFAATWLNESVIV